MSWILGQHHIKRVTVTDVVPMTRKDLQMSVIFTVSTQCYTEGP